MKACKTKTPFDPILRRYTLSGAILFGSAGLVLGFRFALERIVSQPVAALTPTMELFLLTAFISISGCAAGVIFGAFVGSTIYRMKTKGK